MSQKPTPPSPPLSRSPQTPELDEARASTAPLASIADPSRRRFLKMVGIGLAAPSFLRMAPGCGDDGGGGGGKTGPITLSEATFPQSIASGDPRPDSVVLWARAVDTTATGALEVTLIVASDEALEDVIAEQTLQATALNDHVLKVKVSGLDPATRYYYRFVYEKAKGVRLASRVGRTKTAPTSDADVPVKMVLASCQDLIARYYYSYAKMAELADDLDVVVHVGDYIYETTGDPTFQSEGTEERQVVFSDTAGAIPFYGDDGEVVAYAAKSLSNYRELYKTYRSDKHLQAVHEKVPFVFIWDDHEFSDDCWGDNATYSDGKVDETNQLDRRKAAEQAYFEFQPTEVGLAADGASFDIGDKVPVADPDVVIYKDLRFGKHAHLILTDTRSYRPDHAIREDACYAAIAATEAELEANGFDPMEAKDGVGVYTPYVDLDGAHASYKAAVVTGLTAAYAKLLPDVDASVHAAKAADASQGLFSAVAVNALAEAAITGGTLTALDVSATSELPRGMTIDHMRFSLGRLFSANGLHARYLVEKRHYELYQKLRYAKDPRAQDVFGAKQEAWVKATLAGSNATWKLFATSIGMSPMIVDVSAEAFPPSLESVPELADLQSGLGLFRSLLKSPYLLSVDQWDGFPDKRAEMMAALRATPGSIVLSGDIHSFYVTDHGKGTGANPVFEITGGGISSESFKGFVRGAVDGIVAGISQSPSVIAVLKYFETILREPAPEILYANNDAAGFVTLAIEAGKVDVTLYVAPVEHVLEDVGDDATAAVAPYTTVSYRVSDGKLTRV